MAIVFFIAITITAITIAIATIITTLLLPISIKGNPLKYSCMGLMRGEKLLSMME